MARPLRLSFPGALYHIFSRGNEKREIFYTQVDYRRFESLLQSLPERFKVIIHAYVLMRNHYHLLLETPEPNLSKTIHYLNSSYVTYFNRAHNRSGHLFQGRFKSILVEKNVYLLALSRYIHLNPYRAGLIKKLEVYQWSSYPGYVSEGKEKPWITYKWTLSQLSNDLKKARKLYRDFVREGMSKDLDDPLREVKKGFLLGSETFETEITELLQGNIHREIPETRKLKKYIPIDKIVEIVAEYFNVDPDRITEKGIKTWALPRKISIYLAKRYTNCNNKEIGHHFNIGYTAVSQSEVQLKKEIKRNTEALKALQELEQKLK